MGVYESGENYLEVILLLSKQSSVVRSIDIAKHLGYSKPSISRAVGVLKKEGYILIADNGEITFTDKGLKRANDIYSRHNDITRFLENIGVDKVTAEQDACRIEHVISEKTLKAIRDYRK